MKRTALFALLLILSLTACGHPADPPASPPPEPPAEVSASPSQAEPATSPVEGEAYRYYNLPGVPLPEVEIRRVDLTIYAIGGTDPVTHPDDLREVLSLLDEFPIYDQPVSQEEVQWLEQNGRSLRLDFFASEDGGSPDFSLYLDPCRIQVGDAMYGPYRTGDTEGEDSPISRICSIAHATVPRSERHTIEDLLGRPLPEAGLTVRTVAGPEGEQDFVLTPEAAVRIREALAELEFFGFSGWKILPEELPYQSSWRLDFTGADGEGPVTIWMGNGFLGLGGQKYHPYPYHAELPFLELLAEETGVEGVPAELAGLVVQAKELYLLQFETDGSAGPEQQRQFLAWWFSDDGNLAPYSCGEGYRVPLTALREAAGRLAGDGFDPLVVFGGQLDRPGSWAWYDTAAQEYVVEVPGGDGGAVAMEPLEREVSRGEDGAVTGFRVQMGVFDPNLYYHETSRELRLIEVYEVEYDFPGEWRLVSAKRREPPAA